MDLFFAADKVWPLLTLGLLLLWAFTGWYWLQQRQQQALELMRLHTELTASQSQLQQQQQQQRELQQQQAQQQQHYLQLKEKYDRLTVTLQERQQHFHSQLALLQENKAQLKQEFELLANEILQRKGEDFKQQSSQSLLQLLQPLQADMKGFRDKVESIHTEELKQRAELKTELINLQKLNFAITDQAARLTNALQGQKKTQGNWGELMLENVLENSGLRAGVDYQREVSFHTEEGRRRPDVIVYLPQQKHLVIDAKTSLAAYTRYVNAEQDDERQLALRQHCQAVQERILELADRNYYQLSGLNSPEVVFMFIPIESAYVEALKQQPLLYQQALERNVLVATPTTLLTSLNIVRQLWRFEDQNKHSAELANRAEKFYAKLTGFLESMQGVGKQLDRARESYDKAFSQLYSGKGNLIKQAAEFKDLGVAVKTEMAADLLEKAHLELPLASDE